MAAGFSSRARWTQIIHQRCLSICSIFWDGHGKECTTHLCFCSTICTHEFPCFCKLFQLISSYLACETRPIVSLAIIGDGDFKCWKCSLFHCTLTRWPVDYLWLV